MAIIHWLRSFLRRTLKGSPTIAGFDWPDLPGSGYLGSRAATPVDVDVAQVPFAGLEGGRRGTPIDVEIPQYALWQTEDAPEWRAVVLVQAEEFEVGRVVGFTDARGTTVVALAHELTLLGQLRPPAASAIPELLAHARSWDAFIAVIRRLMSECRLPEPSFDSELLTMHADSRSFDLEELFADFGTAPTWERRTLVRQRLGL